MLTLSFHAFIDALLLAMVIIISLFSCRLLHIYDVLRHSYMKNKEAQE